MKTESNVQLSGKWWYPTREFEISSEKSMGETITRIYDQHNPKWFGVNKRLKFNRMNDKGEREFLIYINGGRSIGYFIEGKYQPISHGTKIAGKTGILNFFFFGLMFILSFPFGYYFYGFSFKVFGLAPLIFSIYYLFMIMRYRRHFSKFVDELT